MKKTALYILFFFLFCSTFSAFSQKDSIKTQSKIQTYVTYNPLSPSKAAFYSAILPGAGQIYNNRYWWQLPLIYGGLGVATYYYIDSSNKYDRYRTAYKLRKAGLKDEFIDDEGDPFISEAGLESAQRQFQKNRDLSLLSVILVYVLQIVEASVTAHLLQFDTSKNLSIKPITIPDPSFREPPKVGFTLKYTF